MKRTSIKKVTLEARILRFIRFVRGISMRKAGMMTNLSDSAINHYEQGRMDLSEKRIRQLVEVYGFEMSEFTEFLEGKPIPVISLNAECISLLDQIDEKKMRAVHAVLSGFVS